VLRGTIPNGITSMAQLRNLDVERNSMSGQPLVKLYSLLNLREIHLSENRFDEQISGPGLSNWDFVKELWIGNNLFRGSLPQEIGKMESLGTVIFSVPSLCLGNNHYISSHLYFVLFFSSESLLVYGNEFTGTIPSSMGANRIVEFIAHENMLDGTVPEALFDNIDMKELRLDSNNLSGKISFSVGDLSKLIELRLGRNQFSGQLPSTLWKLTNLRKCFDNYANSKLNKFYAVTRSNKFVFIRCNM
jgi:hypothetical protein